MSGVDPREFDRREFDRRCVGASPDSPGADAPGADARRADAPGADARRADAPWAVESDGPVRGTREGDGRRPSPHVRRPRPARCLAGLRVVLSGRNRAGRLARVLDALRPAVERGAEVVYVDRGSRDGSRETALRRGRGVRCAATLAGATAAIGDAPPPRFVAAVDLGVEADWRCLRGLMRDTARAPEGAIVAPPLVGLDGAPAGDSAVPPPVWCARARRAEALLGGADPQPGRAGGGQGGVVAALRCPPALSVEPGGAGRADWPARAWPARVELDAGRGPAPVRRLDVGEARP